MVSDRADGSRQVNLLLDPSGDGRDARVDVHDALPFSGLDLGPDGVRTGHGFRDEPLPHERRRHDHDQADQQDGDCCRQVGVTVDSSHRWSGQNKTASASAQVSAGTNGRAIR